MKKSATPTVQASGLLHRMFGVGAGAGNSLPVRKLMLAVLLAAAATCLGVFAVAQTQAADGAMTGVTLTSDSPGTLTVSWNTPSPAPTDYRLRWAPVGSDHLSWKNTNETDRGNAYPAGDATSLTLSGLSEGTEFKVQARARYHKGEHKSSPWSGPWVEVQARVMSQPSKDSSAAGTRNSETPNSKTPNSSAPATPNLMGAAVTPEGHVMLVWLNPADDSITGYQVLRGPAADSLVVIEQDTGSSGTSYTDTAPPAGQTHTYAVKARNASGLSDLSNTLTATVPAAEEEEVLITARHEDGGNTLVSNLGQTASSQGAIVGTFGGSFYESGTPFTTGSNPHGYHLTSVELPIRVIPGEDAPTPRISIRGDKAGVPGEIDLYTFTTSSTITTGITQILFTTVDETVLKPNSRYWVYATTTAGNMGFRQTASEDEDAESGLGWQIGNARYERQNGGTWSIATGVPLSVIMKISGHAAPAVLVSNVHSSINEVQFTAQGSNAIRRYAQTFSAANNADGTQAQFDFDGVTFGLVGSETGNLAASHFVVTVNTDNSGEPGSVLYTLTSATTSLSLHIDDRREFTFNAPAGATLTSGVTYWLVFALAPGSNYFDRNYINFPLTSDDSEVQGSATVNHWSIGDTSRYNTASSTWQTEQRVMSVVVHGVQLLGPLVSNLGEATGLAENIGSTNKGAQAFVTGPGLAGFSYHFQGIRVSAAAEEFGMVLIPQVQATIRNDNNGLPGTLLHTLTLPADFASTGALTAYTLTAPPGTVLNRNTRYWVVFEVSTLTLIYDTTTSTDEDQRQDGWSIDNRRYVRGSGDWVTLPRVIKLAVLGSPAWMTDEPAGEDFPGADFNAHETFGVVTVGTASNGHLTRGLDRNYGQTGDYWYLNTQPGHSYRVKVTFGASTGISTGGSAGIEFLDPDGVDYASSCCESDHNREDSATFVHFTHSDQSREWNRSYMVYVAAFDLYNEGAAVYNGPYLITLTDITGVQQMVHSFSGGTTHPATDLLESGDGDTADIAVSFRTGSHSDGYTLDRIKVLFNHIPAGDANQIVALHPDASGSPGDTAACYLKTDRIAESTVAWSTKPPHTFLATFCASVTLTANTTYWIVFPMTNRNDEVVALATSPAVKDYGSGWSVIGSGKKTTASWMVQTDAKGRIGLWAKEN